MAAQQLDQIEQIDWEGVGLRKAGHQIPMTEGRMQEWLRCATDPVYFIETYWKIVHPDRGLIPFVLRPFQREAIAAYQKHRMIALLCSRQIGKTSVTAAFVGWYIIFHSNSTVGILADKQETAIEIHDRLKTGYENVPHWLKQGFVKWNIKSIKLENGSGVQVSATTINAGRGRSFSIVFLDEFAAVKKHIADKFKAAIIPTIASGTQTKLFVTSTPQGKNHFYKIVKEAERPNSHWHLIKADYRADPMRDNPEWVKTQIQELGEDGFRQEHLCEFIGSTQTLIHPDHLRRLIASDPTSKSPVLQFSAPKEGHQYIMTVDCAEGVGLDYSAIQVIDTTNKKYEQVVSYHDNTIKPHEFALLIKQTATLYNNAIVFVEDASTGPIVVENLFLAEYKNILTLEKIKGKDKWTIKFGRNNKGRLGGKPSYSSKLLGCTEFKRLLENDLLEIHDFETISELESFSRKGPGYEAEEGNNDDLVSSLVLFGWLHTMEDFRSMLISSTMSEGRAREKGEAFQIFKTLNDVINPSGSFEAHGQLWTKIGEF